MHKSIEEETKHRHGLSLPETVSGLYAQRERERERERDRQTDRQTDRHTHTHTHRERERERERGSETEGGPSGQKCRLKSK